MKPSKLIEQNGWAQQHMCVSNETKMTLICPRNPSEITPDMCFCIYGAFCALDMEDEFHRFSLSKSLQLGSLINWQDDVDRTKEEVVDFLQSHGY